MRKIIFNKQANDIVFGGPFAIQSGNSQIIFVFKCLAGSEC